MEDAPHMPVIDPTTPVFTDGACSGNPGPGGAAAGGSGGPRARGARAGARGRGGGAGAVPGGRFASGYEPRTTNQRMELTAVLQADGSLEGELDAVTDSTHVAHCLRDAWV